MPRGFLRSVATSRGWRMTMVKMPVQRSVLARLPFVQLCSVHFTWKDESDAEGHQVDIVFDKRELKRLFDWKTLLTL